MTVQAAIAQSLAHLLPPGDAWPRAADSVWMRLLGGVAASHAELHAWVQQTVAEWQPHRTRTRMGEWEVAAGLPDRCSAPLAALADRRTVLLARLRGWQGAYADSSTAALGDLQRLARSFDAATTLHYHPPFRVGRNRVGQRLGRNGTLHVLLPGATPTALQAGMVCALQAAVPARFAINLVTAQP